MRSYLPARGELPLSTFPDLGASVAFPFQSFPSYVSLEHLIQFEDDFGDVWQAWRDWKKCRIEEQSTSLEQPLSSCYDVDKVRCDLLYIFLPKLHEILYATDAMQIFGFAFKHL
jgi:hypothetical protein